MTASAFGVRVAPIPASLRSSPWGAVDDAHEHAPGVYFVTTPSHGGFLVSSAAAQTMPAALRSIGAPYGAFLAFEEDCCYAAVVAAFPERFAPASVDAARSVLESLYPEHAAGRTCGKATPAGSFHRCGS